LTLAEQTRKGPGRPRAFQDEDVFVVTTQLLLEGGISVVTLQRVASALGMTHQAISQRFSSKSGLLQAYYDWMQDKFNRNNDVMIGPHDSPLAAIRARFLLGTGAANPQDPVQEIYAMPLMLELRRDPQVNSRMRSVPPVFETRLVQLLDEAQSVGELKPCNSVDLAALILAASIGGTVVWRMDPHGSILDVMDGHIRAALRPYLTGKSPLWQD
jgi:AcrR family transcriptional regulator